MARYIELIGVPGVGKTTTYKYLKNLKTDDSEWKLFEELFIKPLPKQVDLKGKVKTLIKGLLGLPTAPKVKVAHESKVLDDFRTQNEELIELFWHTTMTKNQNIYGKDLRFHSVYYMMMIFQNLQAIKDNKSDKCFVLDEGLILNLNYFTNESLEEPIDDQIAKVLDQIFLPSGVVFFEGDIDTVIERTKTRGKLKARDEYLSEEMLVQARAETALEKQNYVKAVESRNIPVLRLEARDSVESKAKRIADFAEQCSVSHAENKSDRLRVQP